jgi:hypothetical protein
LSRSGPVLAEPFGRSLGADLRDARDVVGGVADERQVVDDLLRLDVELGLHARTVHRRSGHGVDQRHQGADQLRHVLVAGGDHDLHAGGDGVSCQRPDDVVRFHALDAKQRQSQRLDTRKHRHDLRSELVRHGWPVRLVGLEQVIPEGSAGRIEDHGDVCGVRFAQELLQHAEHAEHGVGGFPAGVRERRQRVKCAVQVRGPVDQIEAGRGIHG